MTIKWYYIVITLLLLFLGYYLGKRDHEVVTNTIYDTTVDTVYVDSIVYDTDTFIPPSKPIDTGAVIQAFYSKRTIDTTIQINEVKIKFTGSLYENQLSNVVFETQNLRPTHVVANLKWQLFGGVSFGNDIVAPTLDVQYDKLQVGVGYNLVGDHQWLLSVKYRLWQL